MGCGPSQTVKQQAQIPSSDHYEKKQLIGVGNHGRVYKALYFLDHQEYAYKQIDQIQPKNSISLEETWKQHILKLTMLRHAKLSSYYYTHFLNKDLVVITELAKEGTLAKKIQSKGKMLEEDAKGYIKQILQGLEYLHGVGVLHNDLKPNNVLIFPKQQIKITDYGLACLYDSRLVPGNKNNKDNVNNFKGDNIPYMAPEVVKNLGPTPLSDVWSLGCILIQMLTGKKAWSQLGKGDVAFKKISTSSVPPLPQAISKECQNFLESCLAIVPTQRAYVKELLKHQFIIGKVAQVNDKQDSIENIQLSPKKDNEIIKKSHLIQRVEKPEGTSRLQKKQQSIKSEQKQLRSITRLSNMVKMSRDAVIIDQNVIMINDRNEKIKKDDINPILTENQENAVIINNKVVKLDPQRYRNHKKQRTVTLQSEWDSSYVPRRNTTKDIHMDNSSNLEGFRMVSTRNPSKAPSQNTQQYEESSKLRLQTQPSYDQNSKEYFKRPLKLLKKKLRENRLYSDFSNQLTSEVSRASAGKQLEKLYEQQVFESSSQFVNSKLRSYTETSKQEIVINTALAKAERDHYLEVQKAMRKRKEEQKKKWENQLKTGKEILKRQLSSRYYAS